MLKTVILAALCVACLLSPAQARQRHTQQQPCFLLDFVCQQQASNPFSGAVSVRVRMHRVRQVTNPRARLGREMASGQVVAHPAGCPRFSFCGCGAAVRIFGRSIRELWLAANWFRFPRAAPAPGMAAVKRHHVFVLEQHISGNVWLTYDANSGHRLTRIHPRSISGFVIVNPNAI